MCLVWSILCGVFNVFAQSCPVCCHQLDLLFPSSKAQTGFLKPNLEEASTLLSQFRQIMPESVQTWTRGFEIDDIVFNPTV